MEIETKQPAVIHKLPLGVPIGEEVSVYQKKFSEISQIYQNADNMDADTLMYTVYSYETGDSRQVGNLNWGLTVLEPILVNGECNMTRGHFHVDRDCAEIYIGLGGTGLLLLMDDSGKVTSEQIMDGSIHHIDGKLAHRVVNTGATQLLVGACWPSTAGHDYAAMERNPFRCRVYLEQGQPIFHRL